MTTIEPQTLDYAAEILRWQQEKEDSLRSSTGWLTLVGLHWLHEGVNRIGSDPDSDVDLPASAPAHLGTIELAGGQATLNIESGIAVSVDGVETGHALLRDSNAENGPSIVKIGTVSFFIIERSGDFAVRVRDSSSPALVEFSGRHWFPTDPAYNVSGVFIPHTPKRTLELINSAGKLQSMVNPGRVEFLLNGKSLTLDALDPDGGGDDLWFIFKDATNGRSTYGAGRFMYAPLHADGSVGLDFNKAYHPPCAFTPFATCPLPPKENILNIEIPVGERH